jgi:sugar lactone lactonase YvrE
MVLRKAVRLRNDCTGGDMKLSRMASNVVVGMASLTLSGLAVAQAPTVVMTGLDNPRGLAFAPNGALYVTEAGRGGSGPCVVQPGTGETRCFGNTGAITRLWQDQQSRVVEGLESHAQPDGSSASGPNDISFQGTGGAYVTLGLGGDRAFQAALGGRHSGNLIHVAASGKWKVVADVLQHEVDENPAGGPVDSNPFGVLAEPGGRLVVDAGANALLRVAANGKVETVAVFSPLENSTGFGPPRIESVPTAVARGPDGALYVGELTGFPFVQGLAGIYRVVPGQAPERYCPGGFKTIMDLAFGPDGSLYVVENATGPFPPPPPFAPNSGRLSRVGPGCATVETLLEGLDRPTAVAVGSDGTLYVTNHGVTAGMGEVLMIAP